MQMPIMIEMNRKKVLVVGGGPIGYRKAKKLDAFGADVTCLSMTFCKALTIEPGISCITAVYDSAFIKNYDMVVAATNDAKLNAEIYRQCNKDHICCMTVDAVNPSDFSFMATAVKEHLTIGVSTQGGSPVFAKELVEQLMSTIRDNDLDQLSMLIEKRKRMMNNREDV